MLPKGFKLELFERIKHNSHSLGSNYLVNKQEHKSVFEETDTLQKQSSLNLEVQEQTAKGVKSKLKQVSVLGKRTLRDFDQDICCIECYPYKFSYEEPKRD